MQPELIETILVDAQRRMPLLARHLKRLEASCKALDYAWAGPAVEADILVAALALSAPGPHRLRLLVARDGGRSIQTAPAAAAGRAGSDAGARGAAFVRTAAALQDHPPPLVHQDHRVAAVPPAPVRPALPERARRAVRRQPQQRLPAPGRALVHAAGRLRLPAGVQRAELLEAGQAKEKVLTLADLHAADGIRLSNALRGWIDVTLRAA